MTVRPLLARRPYWAVNVGLGVAVISAAVWAYFSIAQPATGEAATGTTRLLSVQQGTVTATVSADGTVASASTASASFGTSGTVTAIEVQVGDVVKKGAVLAKVDPTAANRDLVAARADREAAEDALDRAEENDQDTDSAQARVTQAELAVEEAEDAVAGTVLKATMAGTVIAVNGTVGGSASGSNSSSSSNGSANDQSDSESTSSSSAFVEIADLTRLQVSAAFAEADATKLKEGQVATVEWNALTGTSAPAKVTSIDPNATTGTGGSVTYGVVLSLDSVPEGAKSGQTVSVSVTTGQVQDVVWVNSAAVNSVGNRHTVTVMREDRQVVEQVEIGLEGDTATEITAGLSPGDQVVYTISTDSSTQTGGNLPGGGGFTGGGPGGGGFTGGGPGGGR